MAIYRNIQLTYWTDSKVEDDFTPEDKYFYLYLLTNPQTNICGCYEISFSQTVRQTGYTRETVEKLLDRFEKVHSVIRFNQTNKEILILKWFRYNWTKSEKLLGSVISVSKHVKTREFREYIERAVEAVKNDTLSIPYPYPMDTSVTDTVTESVTESVTEIETDNRYRNRGLCIGKPIHRASENTYAGIMDAWNTLAGLGIKPIRGIDGKRRESVQARIRQYGEEAFMAAIENVRKSSFLQGGGSRGFVIYFDWFIKPNNFPKVLEGNYDNRERSASSINESKESQLAYLLNKIEEEEKNDAE